MFTFGWLTVTAEDLAVWEQFPNAAFTLVKTAKVADVEAEEEYGEGFHLGAFELRQDPSHDAECSGFYGKTSAKQPQPSACWSASAGVASTARGTLERGARVASDSLSPARPGDHGRSTP